MLVVPGRAILCNPKETEMSNTVRLHRVLRYLIVLFSILFGMAVGAFLAIRAIGRGLAKMFRQNQ